MKPLGDLVLVKENEKTDVTKGGIILPDSVDDSHIYGTVIAAGPGLFTQTGDRIPMTVKIGQKVVVEKQSRRPIKMEDEEYLLLRESEILMNSRG